ncbi:MAG: hypothetical protein WBO10_15110 [Pyrinomonadaceae bacterium]
MNNEINTRKPMHPRRILRLKTLSLVGLALLISLGISSLALNTRNAAMQELDEKMPTLNGDQAVYLKKESTYGSPVNAISIVGYDPKYPKVVTKMVTSDEAPNFLSFLSDDQKSCVRDKQLPEELDVDAKATAAAEPVFLAPCLNFQQELHSPVTINTMGGPVPFGTCVQTGNYSTVLGAVAGMSLTFRMLGSPATNEITIRSGAFNGAVVASGTNPLTFVNTFTGPIFVHWNLAACGIGGTCRGATVECTQGCAQEIKVNIDDTDIADINLADNVCDVSSAPGQQCTLRAAIQTANAKPGPDQITFGISGGGVRNILPSSALPAITDQVVINGTTQPGYTGTAPMIELEGTVVGLGGVGLIFEAGSSGSTVKGLTINRFRSAGVALQSNDNKIEKCYIGLGFDGLTTFDGMLGQQIGIEITGARNRIGGDDSTEALANNYISGNTRSQISIGSAAAFENVIIGNEIGALVDGTINEGSIAIDGIEIIGGAARNQIGGDSNGEINAISGILAGIGIRDSNGTIITRNGFEKCRAAIVVFSSSDTVIGGTRFGQENSHGNLFDENGTGVLVDRGSDGGPPSRNTMILGNLFRISDPQNLITEDPTVAIGIAYAEDTMIGNDQPGFENYIIDNTNAGIIVRKEAVRTIIQRNFLGLSVEGELRPNRVGISLGGNGTQVISNRVAYSTEIGIAIDRFEDGDPLPSGNTLANNLIGTNAAGTMGLPNDNGVVIEGEENTVTANLISGNSVAGLSIFGDRNTISQNKVGTDITGTVAIPNLGGIVIAGSQNLIIQNTVSGNSLGITIAPIQQTNIPIGNLLKGNFIGTNSTGTASLPNTLDGILLSDARTTLIGGLGPNIPTDRNVISGNGRHGISLNAGSTQNRISGNYIGTGVDGVVPIGNTGNGIRVGDSCSSTIIGGPEANAGNTIAYNGINGIALSSDAGNNNIIDPNSIFGNVMGGIDIGEDGFTSNDPTDADVGPNKLQNYPTMTLSLSGSDLIVSYQVDSAPEHSTYAGSGIYVEFFEADATGAGRDFLGSDHYLLSDYTNGTPGTRQKNLGNVAALGIFSGDRLTATATDADGNTSEFAPAVDAPGGAAGFEGDVTPRPNGNGSVISGDVIQLRRFATGLDNPSIDPNEFQRADVAPRLTFGDGIINSGDVIQARRYATGLDPATPSAGPTGPTTAIGMLSSVFENVFSRREIRVSPQKPSGDGTVTVALEILANGDEMATGFTIEYDSAKLSNPRLSLAEGSPRSAVLTVNINEAGKIGVLIDAAEAFIASAVPKRFLMVTFDVAPSSTGETPISLTSNLAAKATADANGNTLTVRYLYGSVDVTGAARGSKN